VAIFSVAHLGDAERMFFVSMLLNQVLGWMRTQPGTTSLRALLYMDEIFGYFPPVANPPSKQPLLTLLKQARAYGLGVVLATQNPVDLDYKGLSNTGTWFIGRLQTERDKARVMEGLEGAAATTGSRFNRAEMEQLLAGLGSRVFLMHNTHEDAPVVMQTRWSLSYLRGPLTRMQIKQLIDPYKAAQKLAAAAPVSAAATPAVTAPAASFSPQAAPAAVSSPGRAAPQALQPSLPAEVVRFYIPARGAGPDLLYRPMLVGAARVRYFDKKANVDETQDLVVLTPIEDRPIPVDWTAAGEAAFALNDLEKSPAGSVQFGSLPPAAASLRSYTDWARDFVTWAYGSQQLELLRSPSSGHVSRAGEAERDFRVRLQQAARERRDESLEALRKKYAPKIAAFEEKVRKAQLAVDREAEQARQAGLQTAISVGATLLGAIMGRKVASKANLGKATTAVRGVGRSVQQQGDVGRAKETVQTYQQQLDELNAEFKQESDALGTRIDPLSEALETVIFKPRKTDIDVQLVALVWAPYRADASGRQDPAW
jgi:hypothetical protein